MGNALSALLTSTPDLWLDGKPPLHIAFFFGIVENPARYSVAPPCLILFFSCLLLLNSPLRLHADDAWADGFFVEGGAQYYFFPGALKGLVEAKPGFRGSLGYEFRHIRLSLQSGFTRVTGTNPLVTGLDLIPLYGKLGYRFTLPANFFILPEAGAGIVFSTTHHYRTALDVMLNNLTITPTKSFAAALSLRLGWTAPGDFLDINLGGGFELILEDDGPIPLPTLEAGLSLRPLALARLIRERRPEKRPAAVPVVAEEPAEPSPAPVAEAAPVREIAVVPVPVPEAPPVMITEPLPEPARETPPLNFSITVYFEADTDVLIPAFLPVLEDAVEKLRGSNTALVELRGYAAPVGSAESCLEVSRLRVLFCEDYFMKQGGIPESRISPAWHGRDKTPAWDDEPDSVRPLAAYRCVEIIVTEE